MFVNGVMLFKVATLSASVIFSLANILSKFLVIVANPLCKAVFIGLDVCLSILQVMYDGFKNPKYAPCPLLVNMVNAGKF